jgi:DNA-binding NtrC family response regulator
MAIDMNPAQGEAYSVAVVIAEASDFPEMRRGLLPAFRAILADNERAIKDAVEDSSLQSMLFDLDSVGEGARDGVDVLQEIRAIRDDIVLVAMTRSRDHNLPLRASQAGADEFVLAPVNYEELQSVLARAIEKRAHELRPAGCAATGKQISVLFADWRKLRDAKVVSTIQAVADRNTTVVLRGESGTGKELIASAIVQSSDRAGQSHICLNCSALPESLIESELFDFEGCVYRCRYGARPG